MWVQTFMHGSETSVLISEKGKTAGKRRDVLAKVLKTVWQPMKGCRGTHFPGLLSEWGGVLAARGIRGLELKSRNQKSRWLRLILHLPLSEVHNDEY